MMSIDLVDVSIQVLAIYSKDPELLQQRFLL